MPRRFPYKPEAGIGTAESDEWDRDDISLIRNAASPVCHPNRIIYKADSIAHHCRPGLSGPRPRLALRQLIRVIRQLPNHLIHPTSDLIARSRTGAHRRLLLLVILVDMADQSAGDCVSSRAEISTSVGSQNGWACVCRGPEKCGWRQRLTGLYRTGGLRDRQSLRLALCCVV